MKLQDSDTMSACAQHIPPGFYAVGRLWKWHQGGAVCIDVCEFFYSHVGFLHGINLKQLTWNVRVVFGRKWALWDSWIAVRPFCRFSRGHRGPSE